MRALWGLDVAATHDALMSKPDICTRGRSWVTIVRPKYFLPKPEIRTIGNSNEYSLKTTPFSVQHNSQKDNKKKPFEGTYDHQLRTSPPAPSRSQLYFFSSPLPVTLSTMSSYSFFHVFSGLLQLST